MMQVQIQIEVDDDPDDDDKKRIRLQVFQLAREDANDSERSHAKSVEDLLYTLFITNVNEMPDDKATIESVTRI